MVSRRRTRGAGAGGRTWGSISRLPRGPILPQHKAGATLSRADTAQQLAVTTPVHYGLTEDPRGNTG